MDLFRQLTGKNGYEFAAKQVMDNADEKVFAELVEKEEFLFDFVKENVAKRLASATNDKNWRSVLKFLKYYSPSYEEFIVSVLTRYADEDLTDEMLEIFENGTIAEKIYCAKFFSYVQDPLSVEFLKKYSYSDDEYLSANCASTLSAMNDKISFDEALIKLKSQDDFEVLSAVKFLINYGDKTALNEILKVMKTSVLAENIAGEVPYLVNLFEILENDFEGGLIVLNHIINGLGEILSLSQVFDFELFEVFESLISKSDDSRVATVLLNARDKFEVLTENDEYLFDEDKNTKNEVFGIKKMLFGTDKNFLLGKVNEELREDSPFIYTALEFANDTEQIQNLLTCSNQTVILKATEVLKRFNLLDESVKNSALSNITDENIKSVILAL